MIDGLQKEIKNKLDYFWGCGGGDGSLSFAFPSLGEYCRINCNKYRPGLPTSMTEEKRERLLGLMEDGKHTIYSSIGSIGYSSFYYTGVVM